MCQCQLGLCQAGTSVDISSSMDLIIGAPGPYTWRGTLFTNVLEYVFYHYKFNSNVKLIQNFCRFYSAGQILDF